MYQIGVMHKRTRLVIRTMAEQDLGKISTMFPDYKTNLERRILKEALIKVINTPDEDKDLLFTVLTSSNKIIGFLNAYEEECNIIVKYLIPNEAKKQTYLDIIKVIFQEMIEEDDFYDYNLPVKFEDFMEKN